jgi:hypothetical protein
MSMEGGARASGTFRFSVGINDFSGVVFSPPYFVRNLPWRMMLERRVHQVVVCDFSCIVCVGDKCLRVLVWYWQIGCGKRGGG